MRVSIAMATYNGERFVAEQLASFTTQSRQPDEVVIADDGSTDATVRIVQDWADVQPFDVAVIDEGHLGVGANFGRALAATTGDVVFFSDQDDVWRPNKIAVMLDALSERPGASVFIHDCELVPADLSPTGEFMLGRLARMGASESMHIKGCCTMFTRELADLAVPINADVAHDRFVHRLALASGGERAIVRQPLISYRVHGTNTSGWLPNSLDPITPWYMFKARVRARLRRRAPDTLGDIVARRLADRAAS